MSARRDFCNTAWRTFGIAPEELSGMLDAYERAFAHELAEKIREDLEATGDWTCCAEARGASASLIDPEVSSNG